jgi:O-succinylhomoserine sulfhydrylase
VLGGAVAGPRLLTDEVFKFLRTAGPTLSAFNAWVLLKGLETLQIRMQAQSAKALQLAQWLEKHPGWRGSTIPACLRIRSSTWRDGSRKAVGRSSPSPSRGARQEAWKVVDSCRLLSITANLGDTKTTLTHPASTTHGRITPEQRAAAGVSEDLLRIAVGLEAVVDLQNDLESGLSSI